MNGQLKIFSGNANIELAKKITEVALWQPPEGSALEGFPKKWVH